MKQMSVRSQAIHGFVPHQIYDTLKKSNIKVTSLSDFNFGVMDAHKV